MGKGFRDKTACAKGDNDMLMRLKMLIENSNEGPLCHVKEFGLHLEGQKEVTAGFKTRTQLSRICISARTPFNVSLEESEAS